MIDSKSHILVADVGGTNTRIGLAESGQVDRKHVMSYRNANFASLGLVLREYRHSMELPEIDAVVAAVAGPVRNGIGRLTNLDWVVSDQELVEYGQAPIGHVLNDLQAQGYGLEGADLRPLHANTGFKPDPTETQLVIGIGTGFNCAPVFPTRHGPYVAVSEAGHANLPVWNERSKNLAQFLKSLHGFAAVEETLSGRGLVHCYRSLDENLPILDPAEILRHAANDDASPSAQAVDLFCGCLGRVLGDLSLVHLPFGGVILIGGMARAVAPFLDHFSFKEEFAAKGRFSQFMSQFEIFILHDDFAALDGCARFAGQIR